MPTLKMNLTLSGTCNGNLWPEAGGLVTVDDAEAERLIALGHAEESDVDEDAVDLTVSVLVAAEVQPTDEPLDEDEDEPVVEDDAPVEDDEQKDEPVSEPEKAERTTPKKRETREAKTS